MATYKECKTLKFPGSDIIYVITDDGKVAVSQGIENAGKFLSVGEDGSVTLTNAGDMSQYVYDANGDIANAGGIRNYIISNMISESVSSTSKETVASSSAVRSAYNRADDAYLYAGSVAKQVSNVINNASDAYSRANQAYSLADRANSTATYASRDAADAARIAQSAMSAVNEAMAKDTYDPNNVVADAGGIAAYVEANAPSNDGIPSSEKGVANGVATLDDAGKVPTEQLPSMDYIPTEQKGAADGVATLGNDGKVPSSQLPSMNYIPTSQKGAANGVASLDANGELVSTKGSASATNLEGFTLEATSVGDWERKGGSVYLNLVVSGKLTQQRTQVSFDITGLPLRSSIQTVVLQPDYFGTKITDGINAGSYSGSDNFSFSTNGGRKVGTSYVTNISVKFPNETAIPADTSFKVVGYAIIHDFV